jgi:hypothetical protein
MIRTTAWLHYVPDLLYATLRYLAGCFLHKCKYAIYCYPLTMAVVVALLQEAPIYTFVSHGEFRRPLFSTDPVKGAVWPTIDAIDHCFDIGFPVHDVNALEALAEDFSTYSNGEMKGCVMAIDGRVAQTRKPMKTEVVDVMSYRNSHECRGLVVLAGGDARCRFNMFSVVNTGSTNDTVAWDLSSMKTILDSGKLPRQYYIVDDEAFVCTDQLPVPYSGRGLGVWKDSFNCHFSRMRQCIERSFALLVQRWGILWQPLRGAFKRWPTLLTVCAKLHNYCLNKAEAPIANMY